MADTDRPNPLEMIKLVEQDNLDVAHRLASEHLSRLEPLAQAERCGATLVRDGDDAWLLIRYMGRPVRVRTSSWRVEWDDGTELPLHEQVLVLHYLESTADVPPPADPISFTEVPSGEFYNDAFNRRARVPLVKVFGERPELALEIARGLGGREHDMGDVSLCVSAFPRVELMLVFWKGDEEFPADVSLLMSSSICSYLSTEDIAMLAGLLAGRLIKEARK